MSAVESQEYKYAPLVARLRQEIINEARESKHIGSWFLPYHLMEVERFANLLCDKFPEADRDIVGLGVWFHDIGRLRGYEKDHDVYGAEEAQKVLAKKGFPTDKIKRVYEVCRTHRCTDVQPESLEAKILATADAMSHFTHGFYFRLFQHYQDKMDFDEIRKLVRKKLERDFNKKILFDEAKKEVQDIYEAMRLVLQD